MSHDVPRPADADFAAELAALEKARHLNGIGRHDLARDSAQAGLRVAPRSSELLAELAAAHFGLGQHLEAESVVREALECDPESGRALYMYARLLREGGRYPESEKVLLDALALQPLNPYLHIEYGSVMLVTGHKQKAEDLARRAVALDPDNDDAHAFLSLVLGERNKALESHAVGAQSVRLGPDEDLPHAALGISYLRTGRPYKARRHLREALRIEPNNPGLQEVFVEADYACRPIFWVMYYWSLVVERLPGKQFAVWIAFIVLVRMLPRMGVPDEVVLPFALTYLGVCLYTWIAYPLVRLWVRIFPAR